MFLKFTILVLKSLGRNKLRTVLTSVGVIVLVAIYAIVTNVTATIKQKAASGVQTRLVVSERWTAPSRIPIRYVDEIRTLPGVVNYTTWNLLTGMVEQGGSSTAAVVIATEQSSLREMHNGLKKLTDEAYESFCERKDGALIGPGLMGVMNWHVGQRFTLTGVRFPPVDMEFTVAGVLPSGDFSNAIFCRHDYYMDVTNDKNAVNCMWVETDSEESSKEIAATLSRDYENRQPALKIETESAGVARVAARNQQVLRIVDGVVLILLIDMIVILSNSISISVRERRVEMAVLKVLGFQPLHIMLMVIAEAMFVGAIAGLIGTGTVCLLSELTVRELLPATPATRFLLQFPVPWSAAAWGALIGAVLGLTGSAIPASSARSVKVSDVFSRIA